MRNFLNTKCYPCDSIDIANLKNYPEKMPEYIVYLEEKKITPSDITTFWPFGTESILKSQSNQRTDIMSFYGKNIHMGSETFRVSLTNIFDSLNTYKSDSNSSEYDNIRSNKFFSDFYSSNILSFTYVTALNFEEVSAILSTCLKTNGPFSVEFSNLIFPTDWIDNQIQEVPIEIKFNINYDLYSPIHDETIRFVNQYILTVSPKKMTC